MSILLERGGGSHVEWTDERWHDSTLAAQGGFCQAGNAHSLTGHGKALWTSSAFEHESMEQLSASPYVYRRVKHPNGDDLAHVVAALESAEAGLATASGMGAVVAAVLGVLSAGDIVLVHGDVYGGSHHFFSNDMKKFGIDVKFVDVLDVGILESSLSSLAGVAKEGDPKRKVLVYLETVTNPIIRVADVSSISAVAKKYGALVIVDNTFGTPLREKPLLQGADLVVHSATKFLGGHSDLVAGIVVGSSQYVKDAWEVALHWGLIASPFDAWLTVRGIRTLQVRMDRSWATAEKLVKKLSASELVLVVNSAPRCSVFSCVVHNGQEGVSQALAAFHLIKLLPSLGGVTTTMNHPASSSHMMVPAAEREKAGILDGLIRISVGLEDVDDIWADLQKGLTAAKSKAPTDEIVQNTIVDKISNLTLKS